MGTERKYPTVAERHALKCVSWAGLLAPGMKDVTHCHAGVEYESVSTAHPFTIKTLPCFTDQAAIPCEKRHFPTLEECEAREREVKESFQRIVKARAAIVADTGGKRGVAGSIGCPVCLDGLLRYSVAGVNGHIHARCSTESCVSWME
jgi:hypothetical protein